MYHFAHISDIHLSPLPNPSILELFGKRITGYINWKRNRKTELGTATLDNLMSNLHNKNPDHLLISGDFVNLSLEREFKNALIWLEQQGSPKDVTITFGNHDSYVYGAFKKACKIFHPWLLGDTNNLWHTTFPFMRVRNNIAFISVSPAIATPPFQASGYFGIKQAKHLSSLLLQAKKNHLFRVVMIHHPPLYGATHQHKKLWGIKFFQQTIHQFGAELILHGHTHLPSLNYIYGKEHLIPAVGVASASQAYGGKKPPANYNWFRVGNENKNWKCILKRFTVIDETDHIECIEEIDLSPHLLHKNAIPFTENNISK